MNSQTPITIPNQRKRPFQFSISTLLIAMTVTGLALVNPAFAIFVPFVIGISILTVALIVLVAVVSLVITGDRKPVLTWALRNLSTILLVNAFLVAYLIYAINVVDWSE